MHRLDRYNSSILSAVTSKSFLFIKPSLSLKSVHLIAGLYKPASISLEHGLILSSIAGLLPVARPQLHGKRQKRTVSLNAPLSGKHIWPVVDKISNEILPRVSDFKTPKFRKPTNSSYTVRLKQKFTPLVEFEELVSSAMYDTHKGIFLPLSVHLNFINRVGHQVGEQYLRMLRLPFTFYSKRKAPAFDDPATFLQTF